MVTFFPELEEDLPNEAEVFFREEGIAINFSDKMKCRRFPKW
jgi:hypothetical protein